MTTLSISTSLSLFGCVCLLSACQHVHTAHKAPTIEAIPSDDSFTLSLAAPITTWDEAIPLGNGILGGLLWGDGRELRLSLDRGGLWDVRQHEIVSQDDWNYQTMQRLVAEGNQAEINRYFDEPYKLIYPSKIPGGRLVITLPEGVEVGDFQLDMRTAESIASLGAAGQAHCLFSADRPVGLLRLPLTGAQANFLRPKSLAHLGYPQATWGEDGALRWMVQEGAADDPNRPRWAVVLGQVERDGQTLVAVTLASHQDGDDPLAIGQQRIREVLALGYDDAQAEHADYWQAFWDTSSVTIPDEAIQRHYNLVRYFHGAASRRHADPMPLQGVWTADAGNLPPWKGDYHHDLNTQTTYIAYGTAGHFDEGLSYIEYNWRLRDHYRQFARDFYGVDGLIVPGVADGVGNPIGGWGMYSLSPTHTAWIAQIFHRHWKLTADPSFLRMRAYPFMRDVAEALLALCVEDENGHLVLPLSASPEIHNNSQRSWLEPNSNYDNSMLRIAFAVTAEMATELGETDVAERFAVALARLQSWHVDETGLMFSQGEPFNQSHRHHSHLMGIHPFSQITIENGSEDQSIIDASLAAVEQNGTQAWVGYSFSWMSCIYARAGQADQALRYLQDFERAFILRNGFHVNGDQIGAGLSNFRYRPFTLEGNFLAMEAVHQILLQSWGGRVRIFPAVADVWQDAAFTDLRAEGGFKVSARREAGATKEVRIEATVDQILRLRDPFPDLPVTWNLPVTRDGEDLLIDMRAGQILYTRFVPIRQ